MTTQNERFHQSPHPAQARESISDDLISATRAWAKSEAGFAVANQLAEPIGILLKYLRELRNRDIAHPDSDSEQQSVHNLTGEALLSVERVRDRLNALIEAAAPPVDGEVYSGVHAGALLARGGRSHGADGTALAGPSSSDRNVLTSREREVLSIITTGGSNKMGAYQLGISARTFEVHRANIMRKVGARNAADLVRMTLVGSARR